ncbi:hypothetical protein FQN54_006126 [Arachnomyces sp. PD_36]|nr:hypothetical protein FQN54_006126 [Arachnomyces sp. PD_36]
MADLQQLGFQLAVGCAVLFVTKFLWELSFSSLSAFPGPIAAKFTNIWRAIAVIRGDVDKTNIQLHRQYGPAVRFGPNCISLSDPNMIRAVYRGAWKKSDMYRPNDVLLNGQRMSNIFNTQDENWHNKYLRPIRNLWSLNKVLEYEPLVDETLNKFLAKIDSKFVDGENARKTCPADEWLSYFAWDVAANISFGQHYGFIDQERDIDDLIGASTRGLKYFAPVSQMPWIDNLLDKNPIMRVGPKPTLAGVLYTFKVVAEYQAEIGAEQKKLGQVPHTLDKYVQLKQTYPDIADDTQIVNWLMLSILAGGDTTSAVMRAVVYYLAKSPVAYQKLTSELDNAKLSLPAKWEAARSLPYLDAVVQEAMRMNPGIAMIFERVVPNGGFTLPDGRFIPAGTKVGINPAVTNHDSEVFGDDVDTFNPDRWMKKAGESQESFDSRHSRMKEVVDFIFGAGGRVCMGRHMALLEIYKLFATLYSIYDIKLANPDHKWKYHDAWFVYQEDMPMVITRRNK